MSRPSPTSGPSPHESPEPQQDHPQGDPWHAFGYVVAGVGLYGGLGWLADRWLHTTFLVALGILIGAVLGLYMTFKRFAPPQGPHDPQRD